MLVGNLFQNHPREVTCKKMNNMRGKGISKILSDQSAIRGTWTHNYEERPYWVIRTYLNKVPNLMQGRILEPMTFCSIPGITLTLFTNDILHEKALKGFVILKFNMVNGIGDPLSI